MVANCQHLEIAIEPYDGRDWVAQDDVCGQFGDDVLEVVEGGGAPNLHKMEVMLAERSVREIQ